MTEPMTIAQVNEAYERNPHRIVAELRDVAAWIERTKPEGLLYASAMPTMKEAARELSEMSFGCALILADRERLLRCITMAMGCLWRPSDGDGQLAWLRLLDALEGREPRDFLTTPLSASEGVSTQSNEVENG